MLDITLTRYMKLFCKKKFYILWDSVDVPCILSNYEDIIRNIDDVTAVSFNTWLLSENLTELIEFHHEGTITIGYLD